MALIKNSGDKLHDWSTKPSSSVRTPTHHGFTRNEALLKPEVAEFQPVYPKHTEASSVNSTRSFGNKTPSVQMACCSKRLPALNTNIKAARELYEQWETIRLISSSIPPALSHLMNSGWAGHITLQPPFSQNCLISLLCSISSPHPRLGGNVEQQHRSSSALNWRAERLIIHLIRLSLCSPPPSPAASEKRH